MKRSIAVLIIIAFLVCLGAAVLPAQSSDSATAKLSGTTKDLYVKTIYIMKVYPHALGYKVNYLTANGYLATTYIPLTWFSGTAGKAELVSEVNDSVPYMEIIFDAGKFKFVRLHVGPSYADRGWGSLGSGVNIDDKFKVDDLQLTY